MKSTRYILKFYNISIYYLSSEVDFVSVVSIAFINLTMVTISPSKFFKFLSTSCMPFATSCKV